MEGGCSSLFSWTMSLIVLILFVILILVLLGGGYTAAATMLSPRGGSIVGLMFLMGRQIHCD